MHYIGPHKLPRERWFNVFPRAPKPLVDCMQAGASRKTAYATRAWI